MCVCVACSVWCAWQGGWSHPRQVPPAQAGSQEAGTWVAAQAGGRWSALVVPTRFQVPQPPVPMGGPMAVGREPCWCGRAVAGVGHVQCGRQHEWRRLCCLPVLSIDHTTPLNPRNAMSIYIQYTRDE